MRTKTVMEQMNAEKPDDVLADLEAKHGRPPVTGLTMSNEIETKAKPESAATSAPVTGWDALREDIERRLSEARRERGQLSGLNRISQTGQFYKGEIAALTYLLERDDARRQAQPNSD